MKKVRILSRSVAACALFTLLLTSCRKENSSAEVTEEDVADVITQAVASSSGGVTAQTTDAARIAAKYSTACGAAKDTSIVYVNAANAAVTYSLTASWHWSLTCGASPYFDFTYNGNTVYDAPRMSSNDKVAATLRISGLGAASAAYTANMQITRNGSQTSKVRNKNVFTSLLTLTGTDVAVSKQTLLVDSGTLAVTFTGSGTGGRSFAFAGKLVFKGNRTGVLTLNSGASYTINW
ncbi:hypothetical protein HNQ91_005288 [Filimonas zeae]|uniref:Uncharacterized protein n=1 Tax=Filimonas zeae TaxID=1737353 RepID=A0A917MY82_9BACT|nr:hypothetical protein [Filimonas zeae]MDR6342211.1 hypothetical protein [Filimonas zeae]GGH78668.1 hypothetical protein GCM10011379_46870 [Filimonas zeae]